MNTARQLLWLPTSREEKYKAKQAIDTFFVRGGDVLSAAVVYVGARRMGVAGFAAVNVALTLVWITVALLILRRHRDLARLASGPSIGVAAVLVAVLPVVALL
jgi:AAA family ATP:ADP antiporter